MLEDNIMNRISDIKKGDIITFKTTNDNKYKVLLCTSVFKDKSPQNFTFAALTYDSKEKPTTEKILESEFFGIGNTTNDHFKYSDQELQKMWTLHPEIKPYFLGSYGLVIWRKDFMTFRNNFELIDNFNIVEKKKKNGNGSMNSSDWNFIQDFFHEKYKTILIDRGQKTFKVKSIVRD